MLSLPLLKFFWDDIDITLPSNFSGVTVPGLHLLWRVYHTKNTSRSSYLIKVLTSYSLIANLFAFHDPASALLSVSPRLFPLAFHPPSLPSEILSSSYSHRPPPWTTTRPHLTMGTLFFLACAGAIVPCELVVVGGLGFGKMSSQIVSF